MIELINNLKFGDVFTVRNSLKGIAVVLLLFRCAATDLAYARPISTPNVLVLLSFHMSLPWTESFLQGLDQARDQYGGNINYYIEFMDSIRLGNSVTDEEWIAYLTEKYQGVDFDAAIAESARASLFLNNNREKLLDSKPIVYYTGVNTDNLPQCKTLKYQEDKAVTGTFSLALAQNPSSKDIVIIDGSDVESRNVLKVLLPLLDQFQDENIDIIKDFTLEELIDKVSQLSPESIVFYNLVFTDRTGKKFVPKDVLHKLAEVSPAPIYSFWSSLMDSGVVGGHMIDGRETAIKMVEAIMGYLETQHFRDNYETLQTVVDWNAVERYEIDPDSIPKAANVINKPITLFDMYANEIKYLIFFIVLIFILTLLWMRKLTELNKRLINEKSRAENLARIDLLTGMHNRRAFFEMSTQACNEAKRLRLPLSIMLLDLDHFKKVNDTYGHLAGDTVLQSFADVIRQSKRDIDIVARFGGEEFILLLPFSDAKGSLNLAERIRKECEKTIFRYKEHELHITFSAGIFCDMEFSSPCSISEAIQYADNALYMAKRGGRNQTVISPNSFAYQPLLQ